MYIFICITITHLRLSHHLDGNTIRCSCAKDKAKISSGRNEGSFVGTLGLVLQLTINRFGHDRVAEGQEAEKHMGVLLIRADGIQQRAIVPAEVTLVMRIGRKVNTLKGL